MGIDSDQQYDLSYGERDKIRRRLEIKQRLKMEGVNRRYSPFLHLAREPFSDPAMERYADFRKKGRMPGAPLRPTLFFGMVAFVFVPIIVLAELIKWERKDFLRDSAVGDYPLEKRRGKAIT